MDRYPLRFRPILKERVWGGRALASRFGRAAEVEAPIGESWELVDRDPEVSVVVNGTYAGRTIRELCQLYGRDLLGEASLSVDRFHLIVKLLDPNDRLSVQVHPTRSYVRRHPEAEASKTELWYALDATPDAQIVYGLQSRVTPAQVGEAIQNGTLEKHLRFVPVEPSGIYFIPSGLVHALLPGSIIVEIQENSDTTYRLYDWGRVGLDGQPRALHVAEALETLETFQADPSLARHEELTPCEVAPGVRQLKGVRCPSFCIREYQIETGATNVPLDRESFTIVVAVAGEMTAHCQEAADMMERLQQGDSALMPAGTEALSLNVEKPARLLTASILPPNRTRTSGTTD